MSELDPSLLTLLDRAEAEAKRAGHEEPGPADLAAAIAARDEQEFDHVFGEGSADRLRRRLPSIGPKGDRADVVEILGGLDSKGAAAIVAALEERLDWLPEVLAAAKAAPSEAPARTQAGEDAGNLGAYGPPEGISELVEIVSPDPAMIGRDDLVDELVALLSRQRPASVLLSGDEGSGKTSALTALATRLGADDYDGPLAGLPVIRIRPEAILADNPIDALDRSLDGLDSGEIVAIDDLETVSVLSSGSALLAVLTRIRAAVDNPNVRLVLLIDSRYVGDLEAAHGELTDELARVRVEPLEGEDLDRIGEDRGPQLASHHGVELPAEVLRLAAAPAASGDNRAHPGLLIDRLDAACAWAALRDDRTTRDADLELPAEIAPPDGATLKEALAKRVKAQEQAIEIVADRLALARARLDLSPDRPDGIFLFAGPTGVGKTELAKAICEALYGEEDRLIRLDMSEYAQPWSIARLTGPQPGYVGFTEPSAWLTTRIIERPDTVLLLDEIEKAHPDVWNAFLQVFDAGRLSDSRGQVADFSAVVIVMTSNLGSEIFGSMPIGFGERDEKSQAAYEDTGVIEAIEKAMPPELINRIDEIVPFRPLGRESIRVIAELVCDQIVGRLRERGYRLAIPAEVIDLVAETGYDPAYGARHLHRNVERLLLQPLAAMEDRDLKASVNGRAVSWVKAGVEV